MTCSVLICTLLHSHHRTRVQYLETMGLTLIDMFASTEEQQHKNVQFAETTTKKRKRAYVEEHNSLVNKILEQTPEHLKKKLKIQKAEDNSCVGQRDDSKQFLGTKCSAALKKAWSMDEKLTRLFGSPGKPDTQVHKTGKLRPREGVCVQIPRPAASLKSGAAVKKAGSMDEKLTRLFGSPGKPDTQVDKTGKLRPREGVCVQIPRPAASLMLKRRRTRKIRVRPVSWVHNYLKFDDKASR